ncbi:STE20-related kinase adapter protein beta isoform X2 [Spea bombifrons]|uniref:STE20-related kinase adapter protein beta isoform X2 n=1 Tax=Spea bombifrons TaxID=233779 RepID=UPI002349745F|nr:STE20-related kinase adapter protein beta isoform X2 [Spea bombifrons]
MSCLDCSCLRGTPVKSISQDKESSSSLYSHWAGELPQYWIPPVPGGHEMPVRSTEAASYELQEELGKGFSNLTTIYLARHTPSGTLVTARITDLESCSDEHLRVLQNELAMSPFFRHPNILTFWKVFTSGTCLWVICPFMAYGSATTLLKTYYPEGMNEALISNILYGALKGLNYLHHNGYIHRNVKGSHILISEDGMVYLSGLDLLYSLVRRGEKAKVAFDFPNFSTSMLPWFSPELLRQDLYGYNVKSDIYSLGITACELATGRVPFMDMHRTQMLLQKLKCPPHSPLYSNTFPHEESPLKISRSGVDSGIGESVVAASMTQTLTSEKLRTPSPKTFSLALQNFVELCLQQDPELRPSAGALLSHDFFKTVRQQTPGSMFQLLPPLVQHRKQHSVGPSLVNWNKHSTSLHEHKEWAFE